MKTAKLVVLLILVILLGIVFVQNLERVKIHFLFITIEMPQIILLLFAVGAGFVLGLLAVLSTRLKNGKQDQ